jgi:NTP pyrophosphatase (non-canonical NTP hydrolase)
MKKDISFKEAIDQIKSIIKRFEKIEGKKWGIDGSMTELSKQVGDLAQLVMAYENYYPKFRGKENERYHATKSKIADELLDIIFMTVRIADIYEIDLTKAHRDFIKHADKYLRSHKV